MTAYNAVQAGDIQTAGRKRRSVYWFPPLIDPLVLQHAIIGLFLHRNEIVERLYFHCSLSVCLSVCLCVCVCVRLCLWTKFQPNSYIDLDAVFAKQLFSTLARTLLKFVTFGQRSRSQWRNINFFFIILCLLLYFVSQFSYADRNEIRKFA